MFNKSRAKRALLKINKKLSKGKKLSEKDKKMCDLIRQQGIR